MILENYESVAERIEKFWGIYVGIGRVETQLFFQDGTRYIVIAYGYREITDLVPYASGWAEEIRSSINRHPLENAETSAIGRMLHNAGISKFSEGIARPSLEEMRNYDNALTQNPTATSELTVKDSRDPWALESALAVTESQIVTQSTPNAPARCPHGSMLWKEGVGKTGKPYSGWTCPEMDRSKQCKAIWL